MPRTMASAGWRAARRLQADVRSRLALRSGGLNRAGRRNKLHGAAADYLDAHAAAIVEVHVASEHAGEWLLARGFVRGALGWWSRSLPIGDRARVVAEIGRELNGQVKDVMARDVERLQPPRGTRP